MSVYFSMSQRDLFTRTFLYHIDSLQFWDSTTSVSSNTSLLFFHRGHCSHQDWCNISVLKKTLICLNLCWPNHSVNNCCFILKQALTSQVYLVSIKINTFVPLDWFLMFELGYQNNWAQFKMDCVPIYPNRSKSIFLQIYEY